MLGAHRSHPLAGLAAGPAEAENLARFGQRQAQTLRAPDEAQLIENPIGVHSIPRRGPSRAGEEFLTLVEPNGVRRDARPLSRFAYQHGRVYDGLTFKFT
jgi:hypothetical protein